MLVVLSLLLPSIFGYLFLSEWRGNVLERLSAKGMQKPSLIHRKAYEIDYFESRILYLVLGGVLYGFMMFAIPGSTVSGSTSSAAWFGIWMIMLERFNRNNQLDQLFFGDPKLVDVPNWALRQLVCSIQVERVSIAGVLFLGQSKLQFQPVKNNKKAPAPILVEGLDSIRFELVQGKKTVLKMVWPDGSAMFRVPTPIDTLDQIKDWIENQKSVPVRLASAS